MDMSAASGLSSGSASIDCGCWLGNDGGAPLAAPMSAFISCCCCSSDQTDGSGWEANGAGRELLAVRDWIGGVGVSSPRNWRTFVECVGKGASGGSGAARSRQARCEGWTADCDVHEYTGESSPRAEVVSFARRSAPRFRMAFLRASAFAAADDMAAAVVVVGHAAV